MSTLIARIVTEVTMDERGRVRHTTTTDTDPTSNGATTEVPAVSGATALDEVPMDVARHRDRLSALKLNADERAYLLYLAQRHPDTVTAEDIKSNVFGEHPHPGRKWGNVQSGLNRRYTARDWGEVVHWDGDGYVMDSDVADAVKSLFAGK